MSLIMYAYFQTGASVRNTRTSGKKNETPYSWCLKIVKIEM